MKRKTHPHPAKFSDQVLAAMSIMLDTYCRQLPAIEGCWPIVLDPFAGVGHVVELARPGSNWRWVLNEIEPEWAADCAEAIVAAEVDGIALCRDWLAGSTWRSSRAISPGRTTGTGHRRPVAAAHRDATSGRRLGWRGESRRRTTAGPTDPSRARTNAAQLGGSGWSRGHPERSNRVRT